MNIVESKIVFRLLPAGNNKYLIAGFWEATLKRHIVYHNRNFFIPKIIVVSDLFKLSLNSYAAKDTICVLFLDKKDPKLSLSELLSMMTRIQFNPTLFI